MHPATRIAAPDRFVYDLLVLDNIILRVGLMGDDGERMGGEVRDGRGQSAV